MSDPREIMEDVLRMHRATEPFVIGRHAREAGRIEGLQFLTYCLINEIGTAFCRRASFDIGLLERLADRIEGAGTQPDVSSRSEKDREDEDEYARLLVRLGSRGSRAEIGCLLYTSPSPRDS